MNDGVAVKTLNLNGQSFQVSGKRGEFYFDNIEVQLQHNDLYLPILAHHVAAGSTILDVGANIGLTTMIASVLVKDATIVSVEPSGAHAHLCEAARLNNLVNHTALNCCVGDYDGVASFASPESNTSTSHLIDKESRSPHDPTVPIKRIDTIVKELELQRLDFIKIDVEGHEMGVLDGMLIADRTFEPLIFMEFNSYALTALGNTNPRSILDKVLQDYGCFLASVDGKLVKVSSPGERNSFIHRNMLEHGCVDDIVFTRSAGRLDAFRL